MTNNEYKKMINEGNETDVINQKSNTDKIDEKANVKAEQDGKIVDKHTGIKKFSDYCVIYKDNCYELKGIIGNKYIISDKVNAMCVPIEDALLKPISYLHDLNKNKVDSNPNIGKHIYANNKIYTITKSDSNFYYAVDSDNNIKKFVLSAKIMTEADYLEAVAKCNYKKELDNISLNIGDVYETRNFGRVRINEINNEKLNIRHNYNKNTVVDLLDFKMDIFKKNNVLLKKSFEYNVGDYLYYKELGLYRVARNNELTLELRTYLNNVFMINKNDRYIFDKVNISYDISKLKINNVIKISRYEYGVITAIDATIKAWVLHTHTVKEINFWDCEIVDLNDTDFLNYLENYKNLIPKTILSKLILYKGLYIETEFNDITKKWFGKDVNLEELGFKALVFGKSIVYLCEKYNNLYDYLENYSNEYDFYDYEYRFECKEYEYSLYKCERKFIFVKLNNYRYLTIKKLNELNIKKTDIEKFIYKLKEYLKNNFFVSVEIIKNEFNFKLLDLFQSNSHLLNFIKICGFTTYKFAGVDVITVISSGYKQELFESAIIKLLNNMKIKEIDEYDLFNLLNDKMGFAFNVDTFENEANKFTKLFFSPELEKIYVKKSDYYKEVYNE